MVLAVALVLAACSGGGYEHVSIAQVSGNFEAWRGKNVEVEGRLLQFTDTDGTSYGVVEDAQQNRIGLKEIAPWQGLVGTDVTARGKVQFDSSFGWYLAAPEVTAAAG